MDFRNSTYVIESQINNFYGTLRINDLTNCIVLNVNT